MIPTKVDKPHGKPRPQKLTAPPQAPAIEIPSEEECNPEAHAHVPEACRRRPKQPT